MSLIPGLLEFVSEIKALTKPEKKMVVDNLSGLHSEKSA